MPRVSNTLLLRAYREDPLLSVLLKQCRSLDSARNELRWLREKVVTDTRGWRSQRSRLRSFCLQRCRGRPLQYILGDQPFGDLDILCRKGVLIPRPETETYTLHTAKLILDQLDSFRSNDPLRPHPKPFRIIDLCSGTGCISLLLHAILAPHITDLAILGLDLSKRAVKLARQNTLYNVQRGLLHPRAMTEVIFDQTDILTLADKDDSDVKKFLHGIDLKGRTYNSGTPVDEFKCDVLISNPPYISQSCIMDGTTARSVYKYEPMMALVPPLPLATPPVYSNGNRHAELLDGDTFYPKLLNLSKRLRANITVLECGDRLQANRVLSMAQRVMKDMANAVVEIWPGGDEHCNSDGTRAVVIRNRN